MLRNNPCAFFNTLYSVYWRQKPDSLTVDQFLYFINPYLIDNCNNLNLLADTLQKKVEDVMEPAIEKLQKTKQKLGETISHPHHHDADHVEICRDFSKEIKTFEDSYSRFKETLNTIKQTQKLTNIQSEFLTGYFNSMQWKTNRNGKATTGYLLLTRIQQLMAEPNKQETPSLSLKTG